MGGGDVTNGTKYRNRRQQRSTNEQTACRVDWTFGCRTRSCDLSALSANECRTNLSSTESVCVGRNNRTNADREIYTPVICCGLAVRTVWAGKFAVVHTVLAETPERSFVCGATRQSLHSTRIYIQQTLHDVRYTRSLSLKIGPQIDQTNEAALTHRRMCEWNHCRTQKMLWVSVFVCVCEPALCESSKTLTQFGEFNV